MKVLIAIQTLRAPNAAEHPSTRHRRVHAERTACDQRLMRESLPSPGPLKVTIRRVSPSEKPLANAKDLPDVLASFRDEIDLWLGIQGEHRQVTYDFGQRMGKKGEWGVEISVEAA